MLCLLKKRLFYPQAMCNSVENTELRFPNVIHGENESAFDLCFDSDWEKNSNSPSGNQTPVSLVTSGDTHHYTYEDEMASRSLKMFVL